MPSQSDSGSDIRSINFEFRGRKGNIKMEAQQGRDQVLTQAEAGGWMGYEPPLPVAICDMLCRRASTFIDIGANTGFYSLTAAILGCKDIRAFEPAADIAEILRRNIHHTLGLASSRIKVFDVALSDRAGESALYYPDDSHGLIESSASLNKEFRDVHSKHILVQTETLDEHVQRNPINRANQLIIKLDVESLEEKVISGASNTIQSHRPPIFVEILPGASLEYYRSFLKENNYTHFPLKHDVNRLMPVDDIETNIHRRDHLLMPKEKMPPCLFDNIGSRLKLRLLWMSGRIK